MWIELLLLLALLVTLGAWWSIYRGRRGAGVNGGGTRGNGTRNGSIPGEPGEPGEPHEEGEPDLPPPDALHYFERVGRQAGFVRGSLTGVFWLSKALTGLVLAVAGAALVGFDAAGPLLIALLAVVGFMLPDLYLFVRRRRRQDQIRRSLSYFVDMIVAFTLSGLALDEAFRRAARTALPPSHPLSEEARLVARELEGGRERGEAFLALGERTGVMELKALAAAMRIGLRLGAPLRETLEAQADLLRVKRREDGLKRIGRTVVVAMFPVVLIGLPLLLVIVFFPAAVEVMQALSGIRQLRL